ncbi:MAG: hypothetical protein M3R48_08920 [Candidatus Dormibacteraeota bacterium]|nr:hypothetical protein [Candidatus Dormibacteraeota bacterium]
MAATRLALVAMAVGGVAACGSTPTPAATGSPSPAATVDRCLVGAWRTTSVTGTLGDGNGGTIAITGGAGKVLSIAADGALRIDNTATQPDSGKAADGTMYTITQVGSATGHVTAGGGTLTVTLDNPSGLTNSIARNGTTLSTAHPGKATDTYTCSRGQVLSVISSGGTVSRFAPAG